MRAEAETARAVCLAVPRASSTLTGGYLYDRRVLEELGRQGWKTGTLWLDPSFPLPTQGALAEARARFDALPDRRLVVIDGLALAGLLTLLPAIAARLDPVALIHHPLADETGIEADRAAALEAAEKDALALVPRIIVTSRWTRRRLADYGVAPERVSVIEPGIDRGPSVERQKSSTVRLLAVGAVTPRKGHAVLIEALSRIADLDWSLRCVGSLALDPACADSLSRQVEQAGLCDRVALLGELSPEQVRREYCNADLFALPSYLEGYGMALQEAIAHGLPVVSTTAGAIPDTVPAAATRLVAPGNVDALGTVLRELIADRLALQRLAAAARESADIAPTWAEAARKFAAVLGSAPPG